MKQRYTFFSFVLTASLDQLTYRTLKVKNLKAICKYTESRQEAYDQMENNTTIDQNNTAIDKLR